MEVLAKRSTNGLMQLWLTIVLPPALILVYLIYINFDFSKLETAYWIVGLVLLAASVLYLVLFGKTMFLPDKVIEKGEDGLHIHTTKGKDDVVAFNHIVDVIAVKNGRMTFLRFSAANRTYGKLTIKTMDKTFELYPISKVDEVKKALDKLYDIR